MFLQKMTSGLVFELHGQDGGPAIVVRAKESTPLTQVTRLWAVRRAVRPDQVAVHKDGASEPAPADGTVGGADIVAGSKLEARVTGMAQRATPTGNQSPYFDGVDDLSHFAWYHGKLSRSDAEKLLANQPQGSYVVRSSSTPGDLSVSWIDKQKVRHVKVERNRSRSATPDRRYKSGDAFYARIQTAVNELQSKLADGVDSTRTDRIYDPVLRYYRAVHGIVPQ